MKRVKNYNEFVNEGIFFKKDEYLRAELNKLYNTDENKVRLQEIISTFKNLNKLQLIHKLKSLGYSEYLIDDKKLYKEFEKFKKTGEPFGLEKLLLGDEIQRQIVLSKRGQLGRYLMEHGEEFTFGMLRAIFKDAKDAKILMDTKTAFYQALPRAIPTIIAPFYPILAIVGLVLGTSRTFNKFLKPLFKHIDSESKYVDFLKTMVNYYMKVPEGDVNVKDRFSRAFVVTDRLIDAVKPEVIQDFTNKLIIKMDSEPDDKPVPDHYIENQLKTYLNDNFDVDPEIPLKIE